MIKTITTKFTWFCFVVMVVLGCSTVTPHDNFVDLLNYQVGKNWIWLREHHQFLSEKDLISSRELPNGNTEKKYKWTAGKYTCINIYEIDPRSNIIIRADYEGRDEDCVSPP